MLLSAGVRNICILYYLSISKSSGPCFRREWGKGNKGTAKKKQEISGHAERIYN